MEKIIIGILFLTAIWFLFTQIKKQFSHSGGGCASGCGKCAANDINKNAETV